MSRRAFFGATVLPCDGSSPIEDAVIITRGERIEAIGRRSAIGIPDDAQHIDCSKRWIVPGLIDAHIHFFQSGGLFTRPDAIDLTRVRSYAEECAWVREHLDDTFARYLRAGITSVVDNGGPFWNYTVRARAANNKRAPHVAVAGPLISSVTRPQLDCGNGDFPIVGITDPHAARELVRREIDEATDFTKIWWIVGPATPLESFRPVAQAVIEESHAAGTRVMVHARELETARAAVEMGVDILVHSVIEDVDDAFVELLLQKGTIYCPTLTVPEGYTNTLTLNPCARTQDLRIAHPDIVQTLFSVLDIPDAVSPEVMERRRAMVDSRDAELRNLRKLRSAGVQVAAGTDAGNIGTLHASSMLRELELMAKAGLTPEEILTDATAGGAKLMGRQSELGALTAGRLADFIVLNGDPLLNIQNIAALHSVVKGGEVYDPASLIEETPADIVQRQLNAYNAHNVDVFTECYTPDAQVVRGDTLICAGHDEIRTRYGKLFTEIPTNRAYVTERSIEGNVITDNEYVNGRPSGVTSNATARYVVTDGAISHVTLTPVT